MLTKNVQELYRVCSTCTMNCCITMLLPSSIQVSSHLSRKSPSSAHSLECIQAELQSEPYRATYREDSIYMGMLAAERPCLWTSSTILCRVR
jgi:hypothetical protein